MPPAAPDVIIFGLSKPSQTPATISGEVYDDLNANGVRDADEGPANNATVYLDLHAMERVKEVCRQENRRISDVICEAVDSYLRERAKLAFEHVMGARDAAVRAITGSSLLNS